MRPEISGPKEAMKFESKEYDRDGKFFENNLVNEV